MGSQLEVLEWDSDFFGVRIGRITASRLDRENLESLLYAARKEQLQCLYFAADPDDADTLEQVESARFTLVDVRLLLEHPFDGRPAPCPRFPVSDEIILRSPRSDDIARLEHIAVEIGHTSRFAFDRRFSPEACPALYRAWLHRLLQDSSAWVTLASRENEPIGLIGCTCHPATGTGTIALAGVAASVRGRGVGTALVQDALDRFRERGLARAEVVTQGRNVPAQRLYQQMGFFTRQNVLYYHKWLF